MISSPLTTQDPLLSPSLKKAKFLIYGAILLKFEKNIGSECSNFAIFYFTPMKSLWQSKSSPFILLCVLILLRP